MNLKPYAARHLPRPTWRQVGTAGAASTVAIALLAGLTEWTGLTLVAAGLGASCVLVYGAPTAPFSQPANVVGGHACTTAVGLVVHALGSETWWSMGVAVGLGVVAMIALRVTHPPAGGNPLLVFAAGGPWTFLLVPMVVGATVVVLIGVLVHHLAGTDYPVATQPNAAPAR